MTDNVPVLIGDGFFDYIKEYSREEFDNPVDVFGFGEKIARAFDGELLRCNFYHAYPFIEDDDPPDWQKERKQGAQSFFDTIDGLPNASSRRKDVLRKNEKRALTATTSSNRHHRKESTSG